MFTFDFSMITIRKELDSDIGQIKSMYMDLYNHCLSDKSNEHPPKKYHLVVEELRSTDGLLLSLVADLAGKVLGHLAFSPVKLNNTDSKWVKLGPVCVDMKYRKEGIGTKLINEGLDQIRILGYDGAVVIDDREYFQQFGFSSKPTMAIDYEPTKLTYAISLNATPPVGRLSFHPAFTQYTE